MQTQESVQNQLKVQLTDQLQQCKYVLICLLHTLIKNFKLFPCSLLCPKAFHIIQPPNGT